MIYCRICEGKGTKASILTIKILNFLISQKQKNALLLNYLILKKVKIKKNYLNIIYDV